MCILFSFLLFPFTGKCTERLKQIRIWDNYVYEYFHVGQLISFIPFHLPKLIFEFHFS